MRTELPNTKDTWVVADGEPLIEISSLGTARRPAGFNGIRDLSVESDKAAFEYAVKRHFEGVDRAEAYKGELPYWTRAARPADATAEATMAYDEADARDEALGAAFDRVLATGRYDTPLPAATAPASDTLTTALPSGARDWLGRLFDHLEDQGGKTWSESVAEGRKIFALPRGALVQ